MKPIYVTRECYRETTLVHAPRFTQWPMLVHAAPRLGFDFRAARVPVITAAGSHVPDQSRQRLVVAVPYVLRCAR